MAEEQTVDLKKVHPELQKLLSGGVTYGKLDAWVDDDASNALFGKASQAAAWATAEQLYGGGIKQPKNMKEWISTYCNFVWAYAGIFAIAGTVSSLEITFKKRMDDGTWVDEKIHPVLDLLRCPNDDMTGLELLESLVVYLETTGTNYWEVVWGKLDRQMGRRTVSSKKIPIELWPIRPDYLTPEMDKDGRGIKEWTFQAGKGKKKNKLRKDQVVPFRYFHPLNPWFGQGSLLAAETELNQDTAMTDWNTDFFANGVTPEGVLTTDQKLAPYQMKMLGKQVKEFLGGKGRKILMLTSGLSWEQMSVDPKDIDFQAGRDANREAILAALGVPPIMVGLLEHAKYDNYALQLMNFHKHTILPKLRRIESCLQTSLLPLWEELQDFPEDPNVSRVSGYRLEYDKSELILEDKDRTTKRVVEQFTHGLLTLERACELIGEPMEGDVDGPEALAGRFILNRLVPLDEAVGFTDRLLEDVEDENTQRVDEMEDALNAEGTADAEEQEE
jgi:HK97 family phage portal protein